jgi:hypothetical protein
MSTPSTDDARLRDLEENVRAELYLAELDGPAGEQVPDPEAERYEARLRSLLGAVEAAERTSPRPPETDGR